MPPAQAVSDAPYCVEALACHRASIIFEGNKRADLLGSA
jgi:hypothetical protein